MPRRRAHIVAQLEGSMTFIPAISAGAVAPFVVFMPLLPRMSFAIACGLTVDADKVSSQIFRDHEAGDPLTWGHWSASTSPSEHVSGIRQLPRTYLIMSGVVRNPIVLFETPDRGSDLLTKMVDHVLLSLTDHVNHASQTTLFYLDRRYDIRHKCPLRAASA